MNLTQIQFELKPADPKRLASLCGQFDSHLQEIEKRLEVRLKNRSGTFIIEGEQASTEAAEQVILALYEETEDRNITPEDVHLALTHLTDLAPADQVASSNNSGHVPSHVEIVTKKGVIKPRGHNQKGYVASVRDHDINFGIGPAGTGKTYLAVACAVEALLNHEIERILLVRPAVEAGEKLGFLPGDLSQKIDPYLRPLYDALYEMLGFETVNKLIERNTIEVAPLAYMRGRTLNNAFIILDESQNTTKSQMKMFLTRIGFGSTAVITGDATQIDLPRGDQSGLVEAARILKNVKGISFTHFGSGDVVRHPLVQRIVDAYEEADDNK